MHRLAYTSLAPFLRGIACSLSAAALLAAGCAQQPSQPTGEAAKPESVVMTDNAVEALLAEQTTEFLRQQPLLATLLDVPEELAGGPYANRLPDYDTAGFERWRELETASADRLAAISHEGLAPRTVVDLEVVEAVHRYFIGDPEVSYGYVDAYFGHLPYIVSQINGPLIDVPDRMQNQQRVASVADARDYLARLHAFETLTAQVKAKVEADAAAGVVPPRAILDGALSFLDGFVEPPPVENGLVTALADKLDGVEGLDAGERQTLLDEAATTVEQVVYPGYKAIAETLRGLEDRLPAGDGIWAQPGGDVFYATAVRLLGDTDKTPSEIHAIGLEEVERITAEMDAILRQQGRTEGTVGERMAALGAETRFLYPDTDAGRAKILAELNRLIERVEKILPLYFATLPTQQVEVRRVPIQSQDGAPFGYYTNPSMDGSRPGIYWINLREMAAWPSYTLPTLTYHEAIPGHHFQVSLAMAQQDLPFLRQNAPFNAYAEGWALYSERLAWEAGLYADDPFGDLGRLKDELFRAVRLVVDTGLHHERWSRDQAIEYMSSVTGNHPAEVKAEIERYMAWPGQALGYKLGMLEILRLRAKAQRALGDRFDLRGFHDAVLLPGAVPMSVLHDLVEDWVRSENAAAKTEPAGEAPTGS